jgi:TonB family protein
MKTPGTFFSRSQTRMSALDRAGLIIENLIYDQTATPVIIRSVLVPDHPSRWRSFGLSSSLLVVLTLNVVAIPILFPDKFEPVRRYLVTVLTRNTPPPSKTFAKRIVKPEVVRLSPILATELEPGVAPRRTYVPASAPPAKPIVSPRRNPGFISSDVSSPLDSPSSLPVPAPTIPALARPRDGVRTGIFAVSEGPQLESRGNGAGTRPGVLNANFSGGDGTGSSGSGHPRSSELLLQSERPPGNQVITPVRILTKPTPRYTAEARAKNIEGDVVLRVIFAAAGKVQVQNVVHGLGYGLDEAAKAAAEQIQFQPATQEGHPVDVAALIHIAFLLAE